MNSSILRGLLAYGPLAPVQPKTHRDKKAGSPCAPRTPGECPATDCPTHRPGVAASGYWRAASDQDGALWHIWQCSFPLPSWLVGTSVASSIMPAV